MLAIHQRTRSDLSARDELDPYLLELIGLVVEGGERMHSLVNDLLDLTRLEQGRATLTAEEMDMREVVAALVQA